MPRLPSASDCQVLERGVAVVSQLFLFYEVLWCIAGMEDLYGFAPVKQTFVSALEYFKSEASRVESVDGAKALLKVLGTYPGEIDGWIQKHRR